jgi:hypothetical protein
LLLHLFLLLARLEGHMHTTALKIGDVVVGGRDFLRREKNDDIKMSTVC